MTRQRDILEIIGSSPLVRLRNMIPPDYAEIYVKLEGHNPGGSVKDRIARQMIEVAEEEGKLIPDGT
ncbi:MAG: pyridoxal-phosphate dependent enzyme, partial [Thermodesulfovibrionales bacterium]